MILIALKRQLLNQIKAKMDAKEDSGASGKGGATFDVKKQGN